MTRSSIRTHPTPTPTPTHTAAGKWALPAGDEDDDAVDARIAGALDAAVATYEPLVDEAAAQFRAAMGGLLASLHQLAGMDGCVRRGRASAQGRAGQASSDRATTHNAHPVSPRAVTTPPHPHPHPSRSLDDLHLLLLRLDFNGFYEAAGAGGAPAPDEDGGEAGGDDSYAY